MTRLLLFLVGGIFFLAACGSEKDPSESLNSFLEELPYSKLSEYGFFESPLAQQLPKKEVIPYDLNTPLFSDYTHKRRFFRLPVGGKIKYHQKEVFDFPVGSILIKTFSLFDDIRFPEKGERLLETRLLVKGKTGWKAYPYIWNEEQTEALYDSVGDILELSWVHSDGVEKKNSYVVPNTNECKGCHDYSGKLTLIGPKAKHLNQHFQDLEKTNSNQLVLWQKKGILLGLPKPSSLPYLANWNSPNNSLEKRARAYLDVNCAHCHNPKGPANNSGLDLRSEQNNLANIGVFKAPVAAGRGSGGLNYDIVPGKPEESILLYRMKSTNPEIAMPEFGRGLVHEEGVELIRRWIANMPLSGKDSGE